jgi:hypothetical protein
MFAVVGSGIADDAGRLRQLDRKAQHPDCTVSRVIDVDDHLLVHGLRIRKRFPDVLDLAARDAGGIEALDPVGLRVATQPLVDQLVQLFPVDDPKVVRLELGQLQDLLDAEDGHEADEDRFGARRDRDVAVARAEKSVG